MLRNFVDELTIEARVILIPKEQLYGVSQQFWVVVEILLVQIDAEDNISLKAKLEVRVRIYYVSKVNGEHNDYKVMRLFFLKHPFINYFTSNSSTDEYGRLFIILLAVTCPIPELVKFFNGGGVEIIN